MLATTQPRPVARHLDTLDAENTLDQTILGALAFVLGLAMLRNCDPTTLMIAAQQIATEEFHIPEPEFLTARMTVRARDATTGALLDRGHD